MTARASRLTVLILAGGAVASAAHAATLPISPGLYVRAGVACRDAPLTYDGRSFTGAHASHCTTTVLSARGRSYSLRSTCRAAGDGSPAKPYTEMQTVTVRSPSRFTFAHQTGAGALDHADYRRCGSTNP